MSEVEIIGIDCATKAEKVGLARGSYRQGHLRLVEVARGRSPLGAQIEDWLDPQATVLLALDAPLGWPAALGVGLAAHNAGAAIPVEANYFFRRATDLFVQRVIGKTPLDVGADRIARTALHTLALLENLRRNNTATIDLAWEPPEGGVWAIEVYPAGTLASLDWPRTNYKKDHDPAHRRRREEIIAHMGRMMNLPADTSLMADHNDVLDAALCVLAGADFLAGRAMPPDEPDRAEKEGWIWVRKPGG